jgi:hypothetical protein
MKMRTGFTWLRIQSRERENLVNTVINIPGSIFGPARLLLASQAVGSTDLVG